MKHLKRDPCLKYLTLFYSIEVNTHFKTIMLTFFLNIASRLRLRKYTPTVFAMEEKLNQK